MVDWKFWWGLLTKAGLVCLGISDAAGILPSSLDIFDKVLTSAILFYFWIKLKPTKFLFGTSGKKLNYFIIGVFYLLVIDTFVPFVSSLQQYGNIISLISIAAGSIALFAIAAYIAHKIPFTNKSVAYCIYDMFSDKKKKWDAIKKDKSKFLKFAIAVLLLFGMSQYLFGLINQWLIVSLDKSLIFVAILFAIKDLETSKIKALKTAGEFDNTMLRTITTFFTTPKKIYVGIGFLLVLHYLSDLGAFFLPYIFNTAKDPYYFSLLGDQFLQNGTIISQNHNVLMTLFSQETVTSAYGVFATTLTYILSSAGILLLMLLPIIMCFMIAYETNLKKLTEKKTYVAALILISICIFMFLLFPWVQEKAILQPGIFGVDFITSMISSWAAFSFSLTPYIVASLLLFSLFFLNRKVRSVVSNAVFSVSLAAFAIYIWNYFISSFNFYLNTQYGAITQFFTQSNFVIAFALLILFLLDVFFYIGGFTLFAYNALKYFIDHTLTDLLNNKFIVALSYIVIIACMIMLYFITKSNFTQVIQMLFSFIAIMLMFCIAFYKILIGKKEYRDDFILSIVIVVFSYLGIGIVLYFLNQGLGLNESWLNFITPILLSIIAFYLARFFNFKLELKFLRTTKAIAATFIGLFFGAIFYYLNEPIVTIISTGLFSVLIFTFFIALSEELLFRYSIYRLAKKSFSEIKAQLLQASIFTLFHFLFVKDILMHYDYSYWTIAYLIAVFVFGYILGMIASLDKKYFKGKIEYAIIVHWITNFTLYALLTFS